MKNRIDAMKTLFEFDVLFSGWDCDHTGWIKEDDEGRRYLILTNHGQKYIAQPAELQERLDAYMEAIISTEDALRLLNGGTKQTNGGDDGT